MKQLFDAYCGSELEFCLEPAMMIVMGHDVDNNCCCASQSIRFGKGYPKGFMAIIDSLEVHREKLFEFYFQRFQF